MIFIILALTMGFILGNRSPFWLGSLLSAWEKHSVLKKLLPTEIDEYRMCEGPHTWVEVDSINELGELNKINVCRNCGFIPSKNLMATEESIRRMEETKLALALDDKLKSDFSIKEEEKILEYFDEELKSGLKIEKLISLYNAGQTMKERFILYRIARSKELNNAEKEST